MDELYTTVLRRLADGGAWNKPSEWSTDQHIAVILLSLYILFAAALAIKTSLIDEQKEKLDTSIQILRNEKASKGELQQAAVEAQKVHQVRYFITICNLLNI